MHLWEMLGMWGVFAMIGFVVWSVSGNRRKAATARAQAEFQTKLLDKLSTHQSLTEFLGTEAGQRLMNSTMTVEPQRNPFGKILSSITAGTILSLSGLALLVLSQTLDPGDDGPVVVGTICAAVGIGFLVSAGIAYTLSKNWGLFDKLNGRQQGPPQP